MAVNLVKAQTLFLISCRLNNQIYYLSNQSTLTNRIHLDKQLAYSKIANYLFKVEVQSTFEQNVPRRFYDPLLIKHHYSNKYLNFHQQREQFNSEGFELCLSHEKAKWTALPCFKYQTKNTQNIQFSERILISQPNYLDSSAKHLFIKEYPNQQCKATVNMIFGYYFKSQIVLVKYHEINQSNYHFGQYVRLYHQQSYSFLVDSKPIQQIFNHQQCQLANKSAIAFKNEQENIGQTLLDCIWTVEEAIPIRGCIAINGTVRTNIEVRLKNVLTNNYLHLMDNSIDDQNYKMMGQQQQSIYSVFLVEPVRQSQQGVIKDTQIRLKHGKIYQYMAVSKYRESHALIEITMDKIPQDEHFYQLKPVGIQKQLTISFLLSLKRELQRINIELSSRDLKRATLQWMVQTYQSLQCDLQQIEKDQSNLWFRREQFKHFIPLVATIIEKLQDKLKSVSVNRGIIMQLIRHNYVLMFQIIKENKANKVVAFSFIHIFVCSLFQQVYVEQVMTEMLKDNMILLSKMAQTNKILNSNLIEEIFKNIAAETKNDAYWLKILKIIDLLYTVVRIHDNFIDINQRIVVLQLFGGKKLFDSLFFPIKIKKSTLVVSYPNNEIETPINNINGAPLQLICKILSFISSLCEDRNIISKKLISNYLFSHQSKGEDIKMITNCFYIRDSRVKSQMLLLLANLYVDSYPRVTRHFPIPFIKMDIDSLKVAQANHMDNEMAQLSTLLKDSMMQKAQKSYYSRPLSSIKNMYDSQNAADDKKQPSFTGNQVSQFKKIIILLMQTEAWSMEMLRIVRMLTDLSILTSPEKVIIYKLVLSNICHYSKDTAIMREILLVLNHLLKYLQEEIVQQINIYLMLLSVREKVRLDKKDIGHMISSKNKIEIMQFSKQSATIKFTILRYNESCQRVHQYFQNTLKQASLIQVLTTNTYDPQTTLQFIQNIIALYTPSSTTAQLLSTASIISQHHLAQYHLLQAYSIQISNLTEISQEWLCSQQQACADHSKFSNLMTQMANFVYDDYEFDSGEGANYKKNHKINKSRQIIMRNVGVHRYILSLLDSNYYLLQEHSLRTLNKKIRQTFQKCFQFMYHFCYQSEQNKELMIAQIKVVKHFINLVQVGQTKLWILLVRNNKKLIQEMDASDFEKLIFKIVKDRVSVSYSSCDYDPLYLQQLLTLIDINGKPYKPNIQKIAKILQEPIMFKKILYLSEQKAVRNQFCLELYKIRFDPIQTPVIYQTKLIELMVYLIKQMGSKNSFLRRSLMSIISLDYLFYILSLEDSFAFEGIPPDMNFMLKIQTFRLLQIYLSIKDIGIEVYNSVELTKFLEYYVDALTSAYKKKPLMVDNEMLYYEHISPSEFLISYYLKNTKQFYDRYLSKTFQKLHQILEKVGEKEKDQNYRLISILINKQKLGLKEEPTKHQINKQRDIFIKWSNFVPSEIHPPHEEIAKNHLFQLLTNQATKLSLQTEKQVFFEQIQTHQEQFLLTISNLLTNIQTKFQDFLQQPMYNLIFMLNQYIDFKVNKQEDPFSTKKPKPKLTPSFAQLIIPLLNFLSIKTFNYDKIFCRKIYHYSLLIISTILSYQGTFRRHQQILQFLKGSPNSIMLLRALNACLCEAKQEEKIETVIQQLNQAQSQMKLIQEQQNIRPLISSLKLIKQLSRYSPFTSYFQSQSNTSSSIDFVELIYTNLLIILSHGVQQLNIVAVERIEYLCQTLASLFTGCNIQNQLIVANKEFIKYAEAFLKIDKLALQNFNQVDLHQKIDLICSYYTNTIPEYKDLLMKELSYFRFSHFAVVNCIKTQLVKLLLASTIANSQSIQKLTPHISIQLLKLSLIMLYEQVLTHNQDLEERFFVQRFQDWRYIYQHQDKFNVSMTLSAYALALIFALEGEIIQVEAQQDQQQDSFAKVAKFLPASVRLLLKELKDEGFFRDILLFYQKYFEAYKFFKRFVSMIEVDVNGEGKIINVLFPRLPLCNKINEDFEYELERESNRLNHHQKNKSLFSFAEKFYQHIEGQIQFDQRLIQRTSSAKYFITVFQNSHRFMFILWAINIIIALLYLLCNFQRYSWLSLQQQSFVAYKPQTVLRGALLSFQIFNLILCFILIVFIVVKKVPFYFYLHLKSFHQLQPKQRVGMSRFQITHGLRKLFNSIGLDLFFISFSFLSLIHPIFSSFTVLYIIVRLQMGKLLIKMTSSLFLELMALIGVLLVFNYLYAVFIYVNLTVGASYEGECVNVFVCMKLFMDQIIKGGFVTLLPNDYINNVVNLRFFMEYSYNILVPGVLISIFQGVMFDRMTFLRERNEFIEKDERTKCFVCGQSQFQIDLNLEGYQKHVKQTHNRVSYISLLFYLKRKRRQKYLFYEHLVNDSLAHSVFTWIPLQTSIERRKKFPNQFVKQSGKLKVYLSLQQKQEQFKQTLFNTIRVKTQISQIFDAEEEERRALESLLKETSLIKKGKSKVIELATQQK